MMKRRKFLGLSIPTTGAIFVAPGFMSPELYKEINRQFSDNPAIESYDIVINGAGLSGYFAAMEAAKLGKKTLIIEKRTSPGFEITAKRKLWIDNEGYDLLSNEVKQMLWPEAEKQEIHAEGSDGGSLYGDELLLFAGSVRKGMLRSLLQSKIDVLLMTDVCGILSDKENVTGVLMACKHGLYTVKCSHFIDASDQALFSRQLLGENYQIDKAGFVLEILNAKNPKRKQLNVTESFGLCDQGITIHPGKHVSDQAFLEFEFPVNSQELDKIENQSRILAATISREFSKIDDSLVEAKVENYAVESSFILRENRLPATQLKGHHLLVNDASLLSCRKLTSIEKSAKELIDGIKPDIKNSKATQLLVVGSTIPLDQVNFSTPDEPGLSIPLQRCQFDAKKWINAGHQCQVIVAGGGTAGAMAAMGSVEKGANTIVVDYFTDLGGTKTMGGVMGYYHGYKNHGFFKKQNEMASQVAHDHQLNSRTGRKYFHLTELLNGEGTFISGAIMCGSLVDEKKVNGILVCRNGKLETIKGDITIDATGDGDLAAFAGATFSHGDSRTGITQNYSQWDRSGGVKKPPTATGRDYDIIDNTKISELQRGLFLSHYYAHYYDFYPMLTVRESRRIEGLHTLDLIDASEGTHFEDMMTMTSSDFDPHNVGSSEYSKCGYLLPHSNDLVMEIPYRSIVPKGLDGMLISGKGISQTHNALQFTRMSGDLAVLGYLTGQVAADQAWNNIQPKDYDISSLQQEWKALGYLTPEFTSKTVGNLVNDKKEIERRVKGLSEGKPEFLYECAKLPKEKTVPVLLGYFQNSQVKSSKLLLAKGLAWFGENQGVDLIVEELEMLFQQEQKEGYPNGFVETYDNIRGREKNVLVGLFWRINQNIALLAMSQDNAGDQIVKQILESTKSGGGMSNRESDYYNERIDLKIIPNFNRILNVCFYAERLPNKSLIPGFEQLLKDENVGSFITKTYDEARWRAYGGDLELSIAAALARCGGKAGYDLLVSYMDDVHYNFKNFAATELTALTGKNYKYDSSLWRKHLSRLTYPTTQVKLVKEIEV